MKRAIRRPGFTLVELLVVIAIIGILISLLLPAVQAAREAARRSQCQHHLAQLVIAVNNYEMAHNVYPPGTIDAQGPVRSAARGYHFSWITHVLPYAEEQNVYHHIDWSVGVYDPANKAVRAQNIPVVRCPSSWLSGRGYSDYAGVHHDVEAPIDTTNDGVFFLNSRLRYPDVSDGTSQTMFLGEKLTTAGDLGWMSGTRATLRNTGTRLNAILALGPGMAPLQPPTGPPGSSDEPIPDAAAPSAPDAAAGDDAAGDDAAPGGTEAVAADAGAADPGAADPAAATGGPATGPLAVGGFSSDHPGGANFAFGDGSIRFVSETIATTVYQQLGNRHDGQLLDYDF